MEQKILSFLQQQGLDILVKPEVFLFTAVIGFCLLIIFISFTSASSISTSSLKKLEEKKKKNIPVAMDAKEYQDFKLIEKIEVSHDTRKFKFALQSENHRLGLPVGQHISFMFMDKEDGKMICRSYTPISSDDDLGYVQFMIKVYFKDVNPRFPQGGMMSQHLNNLQIGETMKMRGPKGTLDYLGQSKFEMTIKRIKTVRSVKRLGMIAGGTGVTPMLQVISALLKEQDITGKKKIDISLLFANQSENDILVRDELETLEKKYDNFHLWYTIDKCENEEAWKYSTGFITEEMISKHLPAVSKDTQIFMCGPPPMLKFACLPALEKLGFTEENWYTF